MVTKDGLRKLGEMMRKPADKPIIAYVDWDMTGAPKPPSPSIWSRARTGGAYQERGFPYVLLLIAMMLAGCGANVQPEPEPDPAQCSLAWSRCMALPDSSLNFASSGVEEIVSCTTTVAGVSSTYACRWPEQ